MINKHKYKILIYSLLLCSGLYLFVQCVKDDSFSRAQIEQARQAEELIAKNVNHGSSGLFTLPVNLHKYNRNPQTKGAQTDTTYNIVVDSLIDHTKGRTQLFDNGWMYYQVPFKSNEVGIYAAITPKSGKFTDSLVTIKCFYLLVDNYIEPQPMRYSVTMIPTHSYHKQNPDYDFLDKPSFSGYILYSLIDGTFVRAEAYKDGVLMDITLRAQSDASVSTKSFDGDWWDGTPGPHFSLDAITITPGVGMKDLQKWIEGNLKKASVKIDLQPIVSSMDKDKDGEGTTRSSENNCTIIYKSTGCYIGEDRIELARGTRHQYCYRANYNDSCCFIKANLVSGESSYQISGNQITVGLVEQNLVFEAFYGKPSKKCQEIKAMMESVPEFKSLIVRMLSSIKTNGSLEWSLYAGANTNNIDIYSGKAHSVSPRKQPFKVVIKLHSHPNGNPIISAGDFSALLFMIANGEYHSVERFYYGVMAGNHLIMIKIANLNKIKQIIRQYPTKEERIRYYNKYAGIKENNPLDENISLLNKFLNSCGFLCYRAGFWEIPIDANETGAMNLDFQWRDASNSVNIYDCYNLK